MKGQPLKLDSAKNVLRIYSRAVLRYPWMFSGMLIGIIGMQVANVIAPLYLRQLFNLLARNNPNGAVVGQLIAIVWVIALWWAVRWVFNRLEHFINLHLISRVMADLINEAFGYLIDHSYNYFISNFAGSLTHKVNKFARSFQVMYESVLVNFFPAFLFAAGAVVVLYLRSPILGIALGLWVVMFVLFQIWTTNLRQHLRRVRSEADTQITATLADAIGNQSTISLFSGSNFERTRFRAAVEHWYRAGVRSWTSDAYIWSGIGIFMMAIEVGLLYAAVMLWQQGLVTVGDFVLIQAYLLTLFERLAAIQIDLRRLFDAFADAGEMVSILKTPHEVRDKRGAKQLEVVGGEVWFDDVNFAFANRPVLKDFNLTIRGGERVALVGPSGAGKTTATKLLLRMYDLPEGEIKIDKQNIASITQNSLRGLIAFVPQEPILFHRTLMDNIRYGRRDATDVEVIEAAKLAHCHEFIERLPQGYATYVGERGIKLSGGERQRVAIARAILKNAPILVLDEATSSLDSESEALIQDALEVLMHGKTVIVIAHRLSTIMRMDRIVVMEQGAIVAAGTHLELIHERGLYQKLWSIQAGGFIGGAEGDEEPSPEAVAIDEEALAEVEEDK